MRRGGHCRSGKQSLNSWIAPIEAALALRRRKRPRTTGGPDGKSNRVGALPAASKLRQARAPRRRTILPRWTPDFIARANPAGTLTDAELEVLHLPQRGFF